MKELLTKYRQSSQLNQFLIKGGLLFLLWRVFRKWMLLKGQYLEFTDYWADIYLLIARLSLRVLGFKTEIDYSVNKLWLSGANEAIVVVYDCLGVNLFAIFTIFILAYPGNLKTKAWYIPAGLAVIFLLNAWRMAALTLVVARWPEQMDLFHHFIFQGLIYLVIFAMWYFFGKNPK